MSGEGPREVRHGEGRSGFSRAGRRRRRRRGGGGGAGAGQGAGRGGPALPARAPRAALLAGKAAPAAAALPASAPARRAPAAGGLRSARPLAVPPRRRPPPSTSLGWGGPALVARPRGSSLPLGLLCGAGWSTQICLFVRRPRWARTCSTAVRPCARGRCAWRSSRRPSPERSELGVALGKWRGRRLLPRLPSPGAEEDLQSRSGSPALDDWHEERASHLVSDPPPRPRLAVAAAPTEPRWGQDPGAAVVGGWVESISGRVDLQALGGGQPGGRVWTTVSAGARTVERVHWLEVCLPLQRSECAEVRSGSDPVGARAVGERAPLPNTSIRCAVEVFARSRRVSRLASSGAKGRGPGGRHFAAR